jgi:Skp family chaperone for outer membrane proteins
MNLKYVDFEKVTSQFVDYRNGIDEINTEKDNFLKEIEPHRKEMNNIISSVSSGLIIDNSTQQQKAERFQQIQSEIMKKDSEFKKKIKEMTDELNVKCFDKLSDIISEWAKEQKIDVISSKIETVYVTEEYDVTDQIIELLKLKDLFKELPEKLVNKTEE